MVLVDILFHNCEFSIILKNWCAMKSLGLIDLAFSNVEFRSDWLKTLKGIRLCKDTDEHLASLKSLRFSSVFHRWVFERQITQIFADLFFRNSFENETLNNDFTQIEYTNEDILSAQEDDEEREIACIDDNHFTNERIVSELLKRSCTNLYTELNFLTKSSLKLTEKMELCIQDASNSDMMMYNSITKEMCTIAVHASQMASLAASRFSEYTNKLLLSTFADKQHPPVECLISAGSDYNFPYIGVGIIEKWTADEDLELRNLCLAGQKSLYDILTITANINFRFFLVCTDNSLRSKQLFLFF
jgi:hypothetical protein